MQIVHHLKKHKKILIHVLKLIFWFFTGVFLSLFLITGLTYGIYQSEYNNSVYPGVKINGIAMGGETKAQLQAYFDLKNTIYYKAFLIFTNAGKKTIVPAQAINLNINSQLLIQQALSIGRSQGIISNISSMLQAYIKGVDLPLSYIYSVPKLDNILSPMTKQIDKQPINGVFTMNNNHVTTFKLGSKGQIINQNNLNKIIIYDAMLIYAKHLTKIYIPLPITTLKSNTSAKADKLGIKNLLGTGVSLFNGSTPGRIFNIALAAKRLNNILVAPGEIFSFDHALGSISAFTGYQQAYVIQNGRTVLGDGGGVCQVSTTLFRGILNAGLPVVERYAHAYRVGFYEENSPPGFDATIYEPNIDLKFKNDTSHYILIQTVTNLNNNSLTFYLYGTSDGRIVHISQPVITDQTPPPPPLYQPDPSLPAREILQTDFAVSGADVYFTRQVIKNGKVIISDKFISNYQPWQAVYLKGTGN